VRILLVNEASGVQGYLAGALREHGHDVTHVLPNGQTLQGRKADVLLGVEGGGALNAVRRLWRGPAELRRLGRFDVVHFVLGITALSSRLQRHTDLAHFQRDGALISYTGLGCDEISLLRVRSGAPERSPCPGCEAFDAIGKICAPEILSQRPQTARVSRYVDLCVTPMPDYAHASLFFPRAVHVRIPLPVDSSLPSKPRRPGPIRVVHAPSRRGFKGTDVILKAIELLASTRSDFVFSVLENLSHAAFLAALADADVLIDQVHSFGAGMAALEALGSGKVVISGNAREMRAYFPWGDENPIVDASADPAMLASRVSSLLDRPAELASLAEAGVAFVQRRHESRIVAAQYIDSWSRVTPRRQ
jgi:hypothetical protein